MIKAYTDGAAKGNGSVGCKGGYGVFIVHPCGKQESFCGGIKDATNNIAELTAIIKALNYLNTTQANKPVEILTDSSYAVKGLNEWLPNWVKKGWRTSTGQPVKNQILWEQLAILYKPNVKLTWVKGHSTVEGNLKADKLANQGVEKVK